MCEHKTLPGIFLKLELPFAKEVLHLFFFKEKAEYLRAIEMMDHFREILCDKRKRQCLKLNYDFLKLFRNVERKQMLELADNS